MDIPVRKGCRTDRMSILRNSSSCARLISCQLVSGCGLSTGPLTTGSRNQRAKPVTVEVCRRLPQTVQHSATRRRAKRGRVGRPARMGFRMRTVRKAGISAADRVLKRPDPWPSSGTTKGRQRKGPPCDEVGGAVWPRTALRRIGNQRHRRCSASARKPVAYSSTSTEACSVD